MTWAKMVESLVRMIAEGLNIVAGAILLAVIMAPWYIGGTIGFLAALIGVPG